MTNYRLATGSRAPLTVLISLGTLAGAALLGLLVVDSPERALGLAAAAAAGLAAITIPSLPVLILGFSSLVDMPGRIHLTRVSAQGWETLGTAGICLLLILGRFSVSRHVLRIITPLILFVTWALITSALHGGIPAQGVQNLAVYGGFLGLIVITSQRVRAKPDELKVIARVLTVSTAVAAALYLVTRPLPAGAAMGDRSYGLYGLVGVAWFMASYRQANRAGLIRALLITGVIGLSLSRTALTASLLLLALPMFDFRRFTAWIKAVVAAGAGALLLWKLVTSIEPLRARFFGGDVALDVGGVRFNTAGRYSAWQVFWDKIVADPWFGHGAGTVSEVIGGAFIHPHNDYLRILYDFGVVGGVLWILAFVSLTWHMGLIWLRNDPTNPLMKRFNDTAFLCLVALGVAMVTDNVIVYSFFMFPVAIIIGVALSYGPVLSE